MATGGGGGGISAGPAPLALASKYLWNQPGMGTPSGRVRSDMLKIEKEKDSNEETKESANGFWGIAFS